jgi:hypothetical protein
MLSFQSALPWLTNARSWLAGMATPRRTGSSDAAACFCEEHPGTVPLGRVLCHTTAFEGLRTAEMMACCDALVLLAGDGTELAHVELERIRTVECASASPGCSRESNPLQSEEHLFIGFDDEQGNRSQLEISFGALDDVGPVHQMCEYLRSRLTPASA